MGTYHKFTNISGADEAGEFKVASYSGHWKPDTALGAGRRMRIVGDVEVTHHTADMSGHGRGGYDRKFTVSEDGATDIPLSAAERDYDDAQDIHDIYDEAEGLDLGL